jgi:hypothetical protein
VTIQALKISLPDRRGERQEHVTVAPVVVRLRESTSLTVSATEEAIATVRAMNEQVLMAEGYEELAEETLAIAHEARSAQIRALDTE